MAALEPASSPVLNGGKAGEHKIPGIGAGFVPPFYDKALVNEVFDITDDEAAAMVHEAAETEGLPLGISAGAALCAAVKLAERPAFRRKNIVVILPDAAERYFSTGII